MFENCVKNCFFRSKVRSPTVSNYFPLDTFGPSKKSCVARHRLFLKKCGLDKFWPDHVSDCFQMFLTVSDRFHFSERLIGPIPCMEGWSSANPCKSWRWIFFVWPLCAYTAPNIASWPWYPLFPKTPKIPGTREIWCIYIYTYFVCVRVRVFLILELNFEMSSNGEMKGNGWKKFCKIPRPRLFCFVSLWIPEDPETWLISAGRFMEVNRQYKAFKCFQHFQDNKRILKPFRSGLINQWPFDILWP